jgi:hypothetical protein
MEDRATILPPPPPLRIAVWAVVNVIWFRLAGVVLRALQRTRRLTEVFEPETSPRVLAGGGRLSSLIDRLARGERAERARLPSVTLRDPVRSERPTTVDAPRG